MNRAFTQREKMMLGILTLLILGAVYYFLAFQPLQARIDAAEVRSAEAQDAMIIEQARAANRSKMLAEIEKMKAAGDEKKAEIPPYNNMRNVMLQLDTILNLARSYDISFSNVELGERLVKRPIQIRFTADNYAAAKQIVSNLSRCRFRCTIDSADLAVEQADHNTTTAILLDMNTQPVQVGLTVTFYEKNTASTPPAEPAPAT